MKGYKKDGKFHPIRNKRSPSKTRKKKFESAKIQSLIFNKKKFSMSTAKAWASDHGFKAIKVEPTKNTLRIRQFSPNKIKRGTECKTIQFGGSGVQGVLCDTPDKFKRQRYAKTVIISELRDFDLELRIEMVRDAIGRRNAEEKAGLPNTGIDKIKAELKKLEAEKKMRTDKPETQSQLSDFLTRKFNKEIPDTDKFPFKSVNFREIVKAGKDRWDFTITLASHDEETVNEIKKLGFRVLDINDILDTRRATFEGDLGLG